MRTQIGKRYLHVKTNKVYWVSNIAPNASDGASDDMVTYHPSGTPAKLTFHRTRTEFADGRFMEMLELHPLNHCRITWNIEDVIGDSDMSVEDARTVLRSIERKFDANIGINWEVVLCAKEVVLGKVK